MRTTFSLLFVAQMLISAALAANPVPVEYVGSPICKGCHNSVYIQWQGSHHQLAMQEANEKTVLADFNNTTFTYFNTTSQFYKKANKFFVKTDGPDGKLTDYEVKYVFGIDPLQQYLIEFPNGHIQSLTIAWDTVKKRWFHLYPDEHIKSSDPLHWTRVYQNWNMMCGECHTTDYRKNYDSTKKSYNTRWFEIDVGCEACHGPGSNHIKWAKTNKSTKQSKTSNYGFDFNYKTASADEQIEVCAPCHSRRTRLSDEFVPGKAFMDHFLPSHLRPELYYADGQILDEVYVYASFLQSSMYQAGVRCSDCHNVHTTKVKYSGNKLCTQCHNSNGNTRFKTLTKKNYDDKNHHFHKNDSKGAQCVECHAPERNYMGVDPRRDHSFRIPRPDLSVKYETPNACNKCHTKKDAKWAANTVNKWYGKKRNKDRHFTNVFYKARKGDATAEKQLISIANNQSNPSIIRATALQYIRGTEPDSGNAIMKAVKDKHPLVRVYAADRLVDLPPAQRIDLAFDLLKDPVRTVRMSAARAVADLPVMQLSGDQNAYISKALQEYYEVQQSIADMPGGQLNLGVVYTKRKKYDQAEQSYIEAIRLDPAFLPGYFNLANLYNELGENDSAIKLLRKGISIAPKQGELYYSLGLLLVEEEQLEAAAKALKQAVTLIKDRPRMYYNYGLLLQNLNRRAEAKDALHNAYQLSANDPDIVYALIIFHTQQQGWQQALSFAEELVALLPERPEPKKILADIQAKLK